MKSSPIYYPILTIIVLLSAWFIPSTHQICKNIDTQLYAILNCSLNLSDLWAMTVAMLNHEYENWLNLIVMVLVNIIIVIQSPKGERAKVAKTFLYYWVMFQAVLVLNNLVFSKLLDIRRASPSIVLYEMYHTSISEIALGLNIKEGAHKSFPAGHAIVAIYWALFTMLARPKKIITPFIIIVAAILCTNRLFTGAHWPSDVIFSIPLGSLYFILANMLHNKYSSKLGLITE